MATKQWQEENRDRMRAYRRGWYQRNRVESIARSAKRKAEFREWFSAFRAALRCKTCGENHPGVLDFHHRDPSEKETSVSQAVNLGSKSRVMTEIAKCDVLCANCHRKLHYQSRFNS